MDVFSAQGRDPTAQWRLIGMVKRHYDKELHSYVYMLEGGASSTSTRMQLPKSDKTLCKLTYAEFRLSIALLLHFSGAGATLPGISACSPFWWTHFTRGWCD